MICSHTIIYIIRELGGLWAFLGTGTYLILCKNSGTSRAPAAPIQLTARPQKDRQSQIRAVKGRPDQTRTDQSKAKARGTARVQEQDAGLRGW